MSVFAKNFKFIIIDDEGAIIGGAATAKAAEVVAERLIMNGTLPASRRKYLIAEVLSSMSAKIEIHTEPR